MKFKQYILTGLTALTFSGIMATSSITASAHSYTWCLRPHWVTTTKRVKIAKIHNTIPRAYSYKVKNYTVKKETHLKIHHGSSFLWLSESKPFNTSSYYTYAVYNTKGHWFKTGIR